MREIKFRAWDMVSKKMLATRETWLRTWKDSDCEPDNDYDFKKLELYVDQNGHVLEDTYEHGICDTHYQLQGKPKYILMQYTGLKDRNSKEIYEGDIVTDLKGRGEVSYSPPGFVVEVGEPIRYWLGGGKEYPPHFQLTDTEVISNIYEELVLEAVKE